MRLLINSLGLALARAAALFAQPTYTEPEFRPLTSGPQRSFGPGHAQVKRMSRKRRNQQRNRSAHRG